MSPYKTRLFSFLSLHSIPMPSHTSLFVKKTNLVPETVDFPSTHSHTHTDIYYTQSHVAEREKDDGSIGRCCTAHNASATKILYRQSQETWCWLVIVDSNKLLVSNAFSVQSLLNASTYMYSCIHIELYVYGRLVDIRTHKQAHTQTIKHNNKNGRNHQL